MPIGRSGRVVLPIAILATLAVTKLYLDSPPPPALRSDDQLHLVAQLSEATQPLLPRSVAESAVHTEAAAVTVGGPPDPPLSDAPLPLPPLPDPPLPYLTHTPNWTYGGMDDVCRTRPALSTEECLALSAPLADAPVWTNPCTKCVLLMLPRDTARLAHARQHLAPVLPGLRVAWAVDGQLITPEHVEQWYGNAVFSRQSTRYRVSLHGLPYVRVKAGYTLAHVRQWEELAASPDSNDWRFILESDAWMPPNATAILAALFAQLRGRPWDYFQLEHHRLALTMTPAFSSATPVAGSDLLLMATEGSWGASGYVVSRAGARKLLQCHQPIGTVNDMLPVHRAKDLLCFFTPTRPVVWQMSSNISPEEREALQKIYPNFPAQALESQINNIR